MRGRLRLSGAAAFFTLFASLAAASETFAEADPPSSAPAAPAKVTLPKLLTSVEAVYPPEALAAKQEASVDFRLTISTTGEVIAAEVVKSSGQQAFDDAALAAVKQFRFEPARRGDTPIAARILYRYDFKLPKPEEPQPSPGAPPAQVATDTPPPEAPPKAPSEPLKPAEPTPTPSAPPNEPAQPPAPVDIRVQGRQSDAQTLRQSAAPVTVLDTHHAKQQTRDLGDVLGGVEGVAVRRSGGLGSFTRFSLNGLYDNQIRFFIDDIPLDIAGSPFGIANVPVNAIDRVEIYRGVLPVRFGADALGGAVNLVSQKLTDKSVYASIQRGSFGTSRLALFGRYHHAPTGLFAGVSGFLDSARNDYDIDVEVADKTGKVSPVRVRRFHDNYLSYGGFLQVGVLGRSWAQRLSLQLFGITYDKDVPHDAVMTRPIGEARYGATSMGGTVRYEQPIMNAVSIAAVASAARRTIRFVDLSEWTYDWFGNRVAKRNRPGELLREPHDATIWQDTGFGRLESEVLIAPSHTARVASTGRFTGRTGTEKASTGQGGIDPLAGARNIFTLITGLEYELNAFDMRSAARKLDRPHDPAADDRLQNIFVLKHYFYQASAKDVPIGLSVQSLDTSGHNFGIGDSVRFRITKALSAKASYELATRIPSVDELFGDSLYVNPNVELTPETSHNLNAGLQLDLRRTPVGNFTISADGFLRDISGLIASITEATGVQYKNVEGARIFGIEGSVKWLSPGSWVVLEGNGTFQDARNVSSEGQFSQYDGERIPNRPWAFANWSARFQWRRLLTGDDGLAPFYLGRYVHEFFRNWESIGDIEFKAIVPTQVSHSIGLSYWSTHIVRTTVTFEVDNLTDEKLYDFFGVQRPGRSYSVKVTGDL